MRLHNIFITSLVLLGVCLLQGCAGLPQNDPEEEFIDYTNLPVLPPTQNGGIYQAGNEVALFEDIKAHRIGDIVTVRLIEQNSAQKSADTSLNKSTAISVDPPTFGGSARPNLGVDLSSGNTFSGESGSSQSNSLNGSIAVTVVDVLPGGNLLVQGEKWIQINQGKEYIRLHGIIRQRDVAPNNTILSTQVADARIEYSGTSATGGNANVIGWVARLIFSPFRPF